MSLTNAPKDYPTFKGPGLYNIINSGTGLFIEFIQDFLPPIVGTSVFLKPFQGIFSLTDASPGSDADSQKWFIAEVGNNEYSIISKTTGISIQAAGIICLKQNLRSRLAYTDQSIVARSWVLQGILMTRQFTGGSPFHKQATRNSTSKQLTTPQSPLIFYLPI